MGEDQIGQLLVVAIPMVISFLKKNILKKLNPKWIPILLTVAGAGVGATNSALGTDFSTVGLSTDVMQSVMLAWSSLGVHQVFSKGKGIVQNGGKILT